MFVGFIIQEHQTFISTSRLHDSRQFSLIGFKYSAVLMRQIMIITALIQLYITSLAQSNVF